MASMKQRCVGTGGWLLVVLGSLLCAGTGGVRAADIETRDFAIQVDNKEAGSYHMSIQRHDDGSVSLAAQSEVHVNVLLVPVYTYAYRGREVWKDGRLRHFESSGKENNKPFAVTAEATAAGLHVKANGQEHTALPEVWTTSFWHLPAAEHRNRAILLMGCDNGQEKLGSLHYVREDTIKVAGHEQRCAHYRVTRDVPYELWYDGEERLVREEWVSNGHRSVLELVNLGH